MLILMYTNSAMNSVPYGVHFLFADVNRNSFPIMSNEVSTAVRDICTDLSTLNSWCTHQIMRLSTDNNEICI